MSTESSVPPALAHLEAECLFGDEFRRDPRPVYERLRRRGPIAPVWLEPRVPGWLIVDYPTLLKVGREPTTWSHDSRLWSEWSNGRVPENSELLAMMGYRDNLLFSDGDKHARLRRAVSESLDRIDFRVLTQVVHRLATRLIDRFAAQGRADLVGRYAEQLPLLLVNRMFGLADDDGYRLLDVLARIWDGQDADRASRDMERYLGDLVAAKRACPGQDVTTWLMRHHAGLSGEELVQHLVLIIGAANTPTANLIANALQVLLTDQQMKNALVGARMTAEEAIDRALWLDSPMQVYPFVYPRHDVEYGRFTIPAGAAVGMGLAAANRSVPHTGTSHNRAYVSFGAGEHRCPARDIALKISEVAIEALMRRLGGMRLAVPADQLTWRPSVFMRGLERLPVVFTPEHADVKEASAWPSLPRSTSTRPSTSTSKPHASARTVRLSGLFSRDGSRSRHSR